jgi:hypothetical protein
MKKIVSLILFVYFLMSIGYTQKEIVTPAKMNKNALFVNASPLLLNNTINLNYERMLKQHMWDHLFQLLQVMDSEQC